MKFIRSQVSVCVCVCYLHCILQRIYTTTTINHLYARYVQTLIMYIHLGCERVLPWYKKKRFAERTRDQRRNNDALQH